MVHGVVMWYDVRPRPDPTWPRQPIGLLARPRCARACYVTRVRSWTARRPAVHCYYVCTYVCMCARALGRGGAAVAFIIIFLQGTHNIILYIVIATRIGRARVRDYRPRINLRTGGSCVSLSGGLLNNNNNRFCGGGAVVYYVIKCIVAATAPPVRPPEGALAKRSRERRLVAWLLRTQNVYTHPTA